MQTYTIEVHAYPQQFIVSAKNQAEAVQIAKERFHTQNNGQSVYETKVLEVSKEF